MLTFFLSFSLALADPDQPIRQVVMHPVFADDYMCSEHWVGQLPYPSDALGQDCMIVGGIEERGFASPYRSDGLANEDWYGWQRPVLAPADGKVLGVRNNPATNKPGTLGSPPATMVLIERSDGVKIVVAHLGTVNVATDDVVKAGQQIGTVGNNGYGRAPHIHIGAFDAEGPLQLRWDLRALAGLRATED
ncbi:M23 family metallopeptidase [Sphingomicrobium flavum]|uniref:M23 family metallopeptidase n=1 Tax=Sphingomicrobium flavum TaxID=1229164 RepID=UPI0021AE2390|nr:M23 family metallopeptidase [Sphingomicrobium flavum]